MFQSFDIVFAGAQAEIELRNKMLVFAAQCKALRAGAGAGEQANRTHSFSSSVNVPGGTVAFSGFSSARADAHGIVKLTATYTFDPANSEDLSDADEDGLEIYVLPKSHVWPSFMADMKQDHATNRNLYFHRHKGLNGVRVAETLDRLLTSTHVAWIGLPGIAKSTGVNYILMKLVSELSENSVYTYILYRTPRHVVAFCWNEAMKTIDVQVTISEKPKLNSLTFSYHL